MKGKDKGVYIGDVRFDNSSNIYSIDVVIRIDDTEGTFIGILKAVWNIQELINVLKNVELSYGKELYESLTSKMIDSSGRLIFSTKNFIFLEDISCCLPYYPENYNGSTFVVNNKEYHENEKFVAYTFSSIFHKHGNLDWILIMEYDTDDIFSPINNLRDLIIIATFIITFSGLFIGYFISRTISKPLITLCDVTKEVSGIIINPRASVII